MENQIENKQNNTKRQVIKHLPNNHQNITQKKNKRPNKQNTAKNEEYWIDNFPPEISDKNYPPLNSKNTQKNMNQINIDQQSKTTTIDKPSTNHLSQDIIIIKETPIPQQQINQENEIDFLSPPVISKTLTSTTSETINTSTSTINQDQINQKYNKDIINPTLYKKGKIIKQKVTEENTLTMTQKLAKQNYRDTGFLSNATADETKLSPFPCTTRLVDLIHQTQSL